MFKSIIFILFLSGIVIAQAADVNPRSKVASVDVNAATRVDPCDPTCYPFWYLHRIEASCPGQVVSCTRYYGGSKPGYKCDCTAPSPSPTPTSSPAPKCSGYLYNICFSYWRKPFLLETCPYGIEECSKYYPGSGRIGYRCSCGTAPKPSSSVTPTPTPTTTPTPTPTSTPTVSPSPKPKCPGPLFNTCFSHWRYSFLLKTCPYGVEECDRYYSYKGYKGYWCKCIIPPTPTSTPTTSPTPTSSPKSVCDGIYYNQCYPFWKRGFLYDYCPYGVETCSLYNYRTGFRCICLKPSPSPSPAPKALACPVTIDEISKQRSTFYDIDVKANSGCFDFHYDYFYRAYGVVIRYEGFIAKRMWVNSAVYAPLKICFHGSSSIINVQYNIIPSKRIYFRLSCAY